MEEMEAIHRCLAGETEAFACLVEAYQARLLSLAWNIIGNGDDARDIAQETLVQAFLHIGRFDSRFSFKSWLFSICVNRCIDWQRKKKLFLAFSRHQRLAGGDSFSEEEFYIRKEESSLLRLFLKKCSKRERAAVSLSVNEGLNSREIANILGCSESTARVHMLNARRKLKRHFSGPEIAGKERRK